MSSILRSSKSFRPFIEFARSTVFNSRRESNPNVIRFSRVLSTALTQRFASTVHQPALHLNETIKKLDHDARRYGRLRVSYIEEGLDKIREQKSVSSEQSLQLIRCCGHLLPTELPEFRTDLVQRIWQTLDEFNVPFDVLHYNALLRVYLENGHSFSPTEILAEMESKGIIPNRVTYDRLISQYCREGDISGATKILEFMNTKHFSINENIFNSLILGHSQSGDLDAAAGILSVMKQTGMMPTSDTYTQLLCAFAKHGKIDDILSTLDKCEASEIQLSDKDLLEIIYQLATNGHSNFADHIIQRLRKTTGYNDDASNVILRLVNQCHEDSAFKILKTMPRATRSNGELVDVGSFFIRQLIKSERPTEKILSFCRQLQQGFLNKNAMIFAVEMAARSGNLDIAVPLFNELKSLGMPVRQHYFWPLICARRKLGTDAVLDVLRVMQSEFAMSVNGETVRDYVIPSLQEQNYADVITILRTTGVPMSTILRNCVHHALTHARLKEAAELASTFKINYELVPLRRPLVAALEATKDYRSWVTIVRSMYEYLPSHRSDEQQDDIDSRKQWDKSEIVGQLVVDVAYLRNGSAEATRNVLSGLVEEGLSMSKRHADIVQERLGSSLTPEISSWLDKLTAGELEPVSYESRAPRLKLVNASTTNLEKYIQQKQEAGERTTGLHYTLLKAHIKANNVKETDELIQKLSSSEFVLTPGLYSQLIELYCNTNNLDKALATHAEVKLKEPDFVLDDLKAMKLVHRFVENDRIDEAITFLDSSKRNECSNEKRVFETNSLCFRILNSLALQGRDADLNRLFNALEGSNLIKVNNVLLGPLIRVHLTNDDTSKTLASLQDIVTKYRCTPLKNEVACKFIQAEDAASLQLLTDLSITLHGEANSLYDLAFSFIECGRIQQAVKILESPVLQGRQQRLAKLSESYLRDGKTGALETLVQVAKNFTEIDRSVIFENLLLNYCKEDRPEKALDLWTQIQDEGDIPSDAFLSTLARFLTENGIKVPFVLPENDASKLSQSTSDSGKKVVVRKTWREDQKTRSNDRSNKLNLFKATETLETLLVHNELEAATQHVMKMLQANVHPFPKIFKLYLTKIVDTGNYETLERLAPLLDVDLRKKLSFESRLGYAYKRAGKSEQFLDRMIQNYSNAKTNKELKELDSDFATGSMVEILEEHPELFSKFKEFAENIAERGFHSPINIIWANCIENGKLDEADRIMRSYLHDSPTFDFHHTLKVPRARNDVTIALNLLKALEGTKIPKRALGKVHSCIIDVYCTQQKYDDALKAVDNAINDVCLENIYGKTLLRVKNGLEAAGKQFPYKIPDMKANSSDGSSSDNDEPPVKR